MNTNFDLKQLRSFLTVIEEKSFTNASRKLKVGQATISHHINQLEETLGIKLMDRNSKKIELTKHGRDLAVTAEKIFAELDDLQVSLSEEGAPGSSLIAASTIPSTYILPKAIAAVKGQSPHFHYSVRISDSRETVEMLKEGSVELGVVGNRLVNSLLHYQLLSEGEIILIGPPGSKKKISLEEVRDLPLVMREPGSGSRKACERALKKHRILPSQLNVIHETSTSESIRESVAAGIGWAFVSHFAVDSCIETGRVEKVSVPLTIPHQFYAVWHANRELSPPARELLSALEHLFFN